MTFDTLLRNHGHHQGVRSSVITIPISADWIVRSPARADSRGLRRNPAKHVPVVAALHPANADFGRGFRAQNAVGSLHSKGCVRCGQLLPASRRICGRPSGLSPMMRLMMNQACRADWRGAHRRAPDAPAGLRWQSRPATRDRPLEVRTESGSARNRRSPRSVCGGARTKS